MCRVFFLGFDATSTLLLSSLQQTILTVGMLSKMVVFDDLQVSDILLGPIDLLVILGATIAGCASLYWTFLVFKNNRTEIFSIYYLLLATALLLTT